jgi:hypothetical protein
MAQVVSIAVELDDSVAVQGVRNIEGALTKVGQKGNVVFTGMRNDQQRAHEATNLFVRTLGIEMPHALEKVIAKSEIIGPLMSTAFKATVVLAVISALVALVPKIESAAKSLGGFTEEMQQLAEAQIKANGDALVTGRTLSIARQNLDVINANIQAKQEYVKLLEKDNTLTSLLMGPTREIKANEESLKDVKKDLVALDQDRLKALEQLAHKEAEIQSMIEGSAKKAGLAGLSGVGAIAEQRRQDIDEANKLEAQGVLKHSEAETQRILATLAASREIGAIRRGQADETRKAEEAATLATLEGKPKLLEAEAQFAQETEILVKRGELARVDADRRIAANHAVTQEQIRQEDKKTYDQTFAAIQAVIALGNRETAAMVDENTKRAQNHLESLHSIGSAEQEAQAAIAELNGNTIAAILIQEQQRETETIAHLRAIGASDEELARMRVAMQAQANVQIAKENRNMVNTLGSDLEGIFNDIFSGNIAKRLLDIAKKFFFQLLAQFLLSFGQVRQMFAGGQQNGGGIFGGLLSMIFGNGGGGIFGGAGGGTTAALGGAGGLFNVGLGAPGIVGSGGGIVNGGGFGGTLLSGGSGLGTSVQGGVSTVGGANQSLLGRLFGGNTAAASSILGGGMMGLSAIIGGLQGGGVVNSAIQGGLGGAMTGFGVAMLAGGPIGAAVGGAIFLASLLAGIFGGGGSRAQAMARGQFLPQISKTKDDYMAHVLEFQAALQQLGQIGANAQQQLGQFGKPGLKAFSTTVQPAIDDATRAILMTERERKARRDIPLNEGQFHVGGLIGPNGMPGGPERANEVRIRALAGEYVVNPQATARNLGLLEQINNGGSPSGGGGDTYNFSFLDVGGLREWLDAGGSEELSQGMDRFRLRYSGGSA